MVWLCVVCPYCGTKVERPVDEDFPPSFLRCVCGRRFSLTMEDAPMGFLPDDPSDLGQIDVGEVLRSEVH